MTRLDAVTSERAIPSDAGDAGLEGVDSLAQSRPMRILHVIDSGGLYGAERVLLTLGSECRKLGHEVFVGTIVSPKDDGDPLGEAAVTQGLRHIQFRMHDGLSIRGLRKILRYAREQRIDVIHSHGYKANILLALTAKWRRPFGMICTLHGWTAKSTLQKVSAYEVLEKILVHRFDKVIAVSGTIRRHIERRADPQKVVEIANGMAGFATADPDRSFVSMETKGSRQNPILLLGIGRLSREKGFDVLIAATRILIDQGIHVRVKIAGDGPLRNELEGMIKAARLEGEVILSGYVSDTQPLYSAADIFVLCSRTEGLPLVLLEAMASGVPVIATPVGDVPDVLCGGQYGRIVTANNPSRLARSVEDLVRAGETINERIARSARKRVAEHYSAKVMTEKYLQIYYAMFPSRQ